MNESTTLHAGATINIADQKGPEEPYQILVGISYRGNLGHVFHGRESAAPEQRKAEPPVSPETPVAVVDSDGDGVTDSNDKQPNTPKGAVTDMWGVALDSDNDGVYDGLDKEPNTIPGSVVDGDGVALDDDGDGVPNGIDQQLDTPKGVAVDMHGVALDDDGDGVPNAVDREPNTPGNRAVDQFGVSVKLDEVSNLPYSIHVESYLTRNSAEESVSQIKARGYNAFTVYTSVPGKGYWYRVYIGHYKTELEAKGFARKLKALGLFDYIAVTKINNVDGSPATGVICSSIRSSTVKLAVLSYGYKAFYYCIESCGAIVPTYVSVNLHRMTRSRGIGQRILLGCGGYRSPVTLHPGIWSRSYIKIRAATC